MRYVLPFTTRPAQLLQASQPPNSQSQNSTRLVLLCAISRAVSLARGALFFCLFVLFRKGVLPFACPGRPPTTERIFYLFRRRARGMFFDFFVVVAQAFLLPCCGVELVFLTSTTHQHGMAIAIEGMGTFARV